MKIAIIGTGYVGLVTGACLANLGNEVVCVDIDKKKIKALGRGILPIYEPGLKELVEHNMREKRLSFTTNSPEAIKKSEVIFIAVSTPQGANGTADLSNVFAVAKVIAMNIDGYKLVVMKSTVPVGTTEKVYSVIRETRKNFDIAVNPEFLREGEAIRDFMVPDRIVIGAKNENAKRIMLLIYRPIERAGRPILLTSIRSAELIKYASNAMLSARISFMNELSALCEKSGADIKEIAKGIGLDGRIGSRYLQAGIGYGGSCFPKDVKALISMFRHNGINPLMLESIDRVNETQKRSIIPKIKKLLPQIKGKKIALWGLSFKPKTDDMREAPSLVIISELRKLGAKISAFDPVASENAKKLLKNVEFSKSPFEAAKNASALVIVTEWDEFREIDMKKLKRAMKAPNIIDGRNIYEPLRVKELGFVYYGVGRM